MLEFIVRTFQAAFMWSAALLLYQARFLLKSVLTTFWHRQVRFMRSVSYTASRVLPVPPNDLRYLGGKYEMTISMLLLGVVGMILMIGLGFWKRIADGMVLWVNPLIDTSPASKFTGVLAFGILFCLIWWFHALLRWSQQVNELVAPDQSSGIADKVSAVSLISGGMSWKVEHRLMVLVLGVSMFMSAYPGFG